MTEWTTSTVQTNGITLHYQRMGGIVIPETAAELMGKHPNLQVAYIEGAGHNIRRDQFSAYMAAVRPFLAEQ